MHAVELNDHALGVVFLLQPGQHLRVQLVVVQDLLIDLLVRVSGYVVFLLALLKDQQQRPLAGVEALVLERLLDEFRLAGLQKAREDVHGDIGHSHVGFSLLLFYAEELRDSFLIQLRADDADAAGDHCAAVTDVRLAGHVVEVDPLLTLGVGHIALGPQDDAVGLRILQRLQDVLDLSLGELLVRLLAPADEDLVGVMAVVMVMMVVMLVFGLVVIVMVMMAAAVRIVALVIVVMVVVVMMVLVLILVIIVVMMVMAAALRIVAFLVVIVIMVMMMVMRFFLELRKLDGDGAALLHGLHQLLAGELRPWRRDDHGVLVVLADHGDALVELFFLHAVSAAEDDGVGCLDLVVVELAEVLHIHLALRRIRHSHKVAQLHIVRRDLAHGADDVRQLADARRLDQDAVRMVLVHNIVQR